MSGNKLVFELDLRYNPNIKGPKKWEVLSEINYDVGFKGSGETVTVPAGYMTDLASVPWPASMLFPKSGKWNHAAVVHDWLCDHGRKVYSQAKIDRIFLDIMRLTGVNPIKRRLGYEAVAAYQKIEAFRHRRDYNRPDDR